MAEQWAIPAEPARAIWAVYDDDNYQWTRVHGGTDAEPTDHWTSPVDGPLLWPELVYRYGPLTEVTAAGVAALGPTTSVRRKGNTLVITPEQVYVACDPREIDPNEYPYRPRRIVIAAYTPGSNRADVETLHYDGTRSRRRSMLVSSLHEFATTRTGAKRARGYVLETEAAE